jgi:AbrB family looped-hinge helix DNA binding protein
VARATVTSKGQVTIPKDVRERLGLKTGDIVDFLVESETRAVMKPLLPAMAVKGLLYRPGQRAVSIAEMDAGIGRAVSERDRRSRRR